MENAKRDYYNQTRPLQLKAQLRLSGLGDLLNAEFGMSERITQKYMPAAAIFSAAPEIVAVLTPVTVYAFAAESGINMKRIDVIRKIEEGQRPKLAQIDDVSRKHKE